MQDATGKGFFLFCAIACLGSLALHVAGSDDEASLPEQVVAPVEDVSRAELGAELDAQLNEEWREKHRPALGDSREERAVKQFDRTLRLLGSSPIEVVGDSSANTGLLEIGSVADLKKVLDEGGSYSGPLPPELMEKEDGR